MIMQVGAKDPALRDTDPFEERANPSIAYSQTSKTSSSNSKRDHLLPTWIIAQTMSSDNPLFVAVVIPALNEAGNIRSLVQEVRQIVPAQIIVADNGSTDDTAGEARAAGAIVVSELRRGYGYACEAGVTKAAELNADVVVFLDADYSFLPAELPRLLIPILQERADLVLGSRWLATLRLARCCPAAFWKLAGGGVDVHLVSHPRHRLRALRAIRLPLLLSLDMQEMTYGYPTEMMVKAAKRGERIVEVPVSFHPRRSGRSKSAAPCRGRCWRRGISSV